jgi:hypothetical protein
LFGAESVPLQLSFPEGETYTVCAEPYAMFAKIARGSRRRITGSVIFIANLSLRVSERVYAKTGPGRRRMMPFEMNCVLRVFSVH